MDQHLQDLTGQRFGLWTVVGPCEKRYGQVCWYCRCHCGTEGWVEENSLKGGRTTNCGCNPWHRASDNYDPKDIPIANQRFGHWTVVGPYKKTQKHFLWRCRCDCGTEKWVQAASLKNGTSKSCGHCKIVSNPQIEFLIALGEIEDLAKQRFGHWTVVGPCKRHKDKTRDWYCRCDCGAENWVDENSLKNGTSTSCGCDFPDDLTNQRFGRWTVVGPYKKRKDIYWVGWNISGGTEIEWYCRCDCGAEKWVNATSLKGGKSTNCGCSKHEILTGQRFGRWTVIGPYEKRNSHAYWYCRCECGTEKWVQASSLKNGTSKSCGNKLSLVNKYGIEYPVTKKKRRKKKE